MDIKSKIILSIICGIGIPSAFYAFSMVMTPICNHPTPSQEWNNKLHDICQLSGSLPQLIMNFTQHV